METLNKIFTEEQINEVSQKVLEKSIEKIKEEIGHKFYHELDNWIYEHYANTKDRIEKELIAEIVEEFVKDPMLSKYAKLRQKLFSENKELLTKTLTDEAIQKSVEAVILECTHSNYMFHWRWKDAIVKIIAENWDSFKNDERVNDGLLRQIENLKSQISTLHQKINDAYCVEDI